MATLLPNGVQQFLDQQGVPLAGGSVYFYVPSTDTFKDTYQNPEATTLNTNPIILDAGGEAIIYGSGAYRQVVYNASGDLIWDQLTADTAVGGIANGGVSTGTANAQEIAASSFSSQDGQVVSFVAGYTNTNALTVTPAGGSAIPVLFDGTSGPVPCTGGEVVQNNEILVIYEQARGAFHLITPALGTAAKQNANSVAITGGTISGTTMSNNTFIIKQSAAPTPTAEGDLQWDTDDNRIIVGNGSSQSTFYPGIMADQTAGAAVAATQAQQETGTSTAVVVTPARQQFHQSAAKAWGMTTGGGSPVLSASYNITSISDDGIGRLGVTIATDFSSNNYSAVASVIVNSNAYYSFVQNLVAGSFGIGCDNDSGGATDPNGYCWSCFGDQ